MMFTISDSILEPLNLHVRGYGAHNAEAGGFLLGPYDAGAATVLALAEGVGIERGRGLFRVSGKAMDQLFAWADEERLRVWAQVHSHPRRSFLSLTDEMYGFRVARFLSGVIPQYAKPPLDPAAWGWWVFTDGEWRSSERPGVVEVASRIVTFDQAGVR
ncbi:MAG: hypothetical protein QOC81_842 [Thermoanaerobaculia bacterium]|jgi:hypothetical protein|nr:hypothetical protein [Thermoanaerobaculia bacterium]